jgi:predicted RNA-binding Zn ribbon-like protein
MARTCKCCTHPRCAELDRELIANRKPYRSIAQDFAVSDDSVFRHQRDHLPKLLVQAEEAKDIAQADDLLAQLKHLNAKARELAAKAESGGDYRTALMAVRELTRLLELTAKLTGELDERAQHNELHVHLPPDRALAVARTYLERHGAGDASSRSLELMDPRKGVEGVELIQPLDGNAAAVAKVNEEDNGNGTRT